MGRKAWAWLGLVFACCRCGHGAARPALREVLGVRVEGRYVVEPPLMDAAGRPEPSLRLAYSLSRISATLRGPDIAVELEDVAPLAVHPAGARVGNRLAVFIDGVELPALTLRSGQRQRYQLARGLAGGPSAVHQVRLVKLTEPEVGELRFFQFVGAFPALPPPLPPSRKIWFLGDSITCGYGALGKGPHCPFSAATEDALRGYAGQLARALGASAEVVAWSGRGVWRNRDGSHTGLVPALFARPLPSSLEASSTTPQAAPPQAVVINLGTNDAARPGFDGEAFARAYAALLRTVLLAAPEATVFAVIGPMLADRPPQRGALAAVRHSIAQAMASLRVVEIPGVEAWRVVPVMLQPQDGTLGFGCDYHPSLATHQDMARTLAPILAQRLGWSVHPVLDVPPVPRPEAPRHPDNKLAGAIGPGQPVH